MTRATYPGAMHTICFYEPGHFHAALTLRNENPRVAEEVHLYARPRPDRDRFLSLVQAFNSRSASPTRWRVRVHESDDPLEQLIDERAGDIVVLAGRNAPKLAAIARLHEAGFNVLADKPWLTSGAALPDLERATAGPPLAMDIMTERFEIMARLRRSIVANSDIFGEFRVDSAQPAIEIATIHHLYKVVNGEPLRRPPWYYDVAVQGDGMVDVTSHLVDQVQWMVAGETPSDAVEVRGARRWATDVPLALYRDSTGEDAFPDVLRPWVSDGVLQLACNGEIDLEIEGVTARLQAEWGQREPAGGGDLHPCTIRGTRCDVLVRHGPDTGHVPELHIEPRPGVDMDAALAEAIRGWQDLFPGLGMERSGSGYRLSIPDALRSSHESHFAMVLETFLDYVDAGRWPEWLVPGIRTRYRTLARAREMALA